MLSPSQHHLAAPGIAWPRANLAKFKPGDHALVARIHGRGRAPGGAMGPRDKPEGDGGGGELRRASTRRSESPTAKGPAPCGGRASYEIGKSTRLNSSH